MDKRIVAYVLAAFALGAVASYLAIGGIGRQSVYSNLESQGQIAGLSELPLESGQAGAEADLQAAAQAGQDDSGQGLDQADGTDSQDSGQEQAESSPAPSTSSASAISLTGQAASDGVRLNWTVQAGFETSQGFKVVKSLDPNPTFPEDYYVYLDDPAVRTFGWQIKNGQTYHFRVCRYRGGEVCDSYSNDVTVKAPLVSVSVETGAEVKTGQDSGQQSTVTGISLSMNGPKASWTVSGSSPLGFKVVWSLLPNPVYPNRSTDRYYYYDQPATRLSQPLGAFDGNGTYYVRVCEYLGGSCGVYSNQVTVDLTQE